MCDYSPTLLKSPVWGSLASEHYDNRYSPPGFYRLNPSFTRMQLKLGDRIKIKVREFGAAGLAGQKC